MIDGTKFILFLSAALVLAVMPGPGILYVLGRTLNGGRREGIHSALGTFLGGLVHAIAAAVGLSALLVASAAAFQTVRYAGGVAYLIYLGITMIRNRHLQIAENNASPAVQGHQSFVQGITTEITKPQNSALLPLLHSTVCGEFQRKAMHGPPGFWRWAQSPVALNTVVDLVVVFFAAACRQTVTFQRDFNTRQRTRLGAWNDRAWPVCRRS